jgi:hypothetical protein
MAYTPELSDSASATLRRIAWAVGKPMTQTMNAIFMNLPNIIGKETVCPSFRDTTLCEICGFGQTTRKRKGGDTYQPQNPHGPNHGGTGTL